MKLFVLLFVNFAASQPFDILLQNGRVIDPKNGIDAVLDVAILDGRIAAVGPNISPVDTSAIVNATGFLVTPGLIDLHHHMFFGTGPEYSEIDGLTPRANSPYSLPPDGFTFRCGVTTAVCPSAGWKNFRQFKENVIDTQRTRVLAHLNIIGVGMRGRTIWEQNLNDMDPVMTGLTALQYEEIVGIKVAHYYSSDFIPVRRAVEAAEISGKPVMIDFGNAEPELSLQQLLLDELRPGDSLTHCYADSTGRGSIVNPETLEVEPFVFAARDRGIWFDTGHGSGSFLWRVGVPALSQGFFPDSISTDLHVQSMNAGGKDFSVMMSKMLFLGMSIPDIIHASTWNPAQYMSRHELGNLDIGAVADVAVLNIRSGQFGLIDSSGFAVRATQKFEAELTIRGGEVVWDLNGLTGIPFQKVMYK